MAYTVKGHKGADENLDLGMGCKGSGDTVKEVDHSNNDLNGREC